MYCKYWWTTPFGDVVCLFDLYNLNYHQPACTCSVMLLRFARIDSICFMTGYCKQNYASVDLLSYCKTLIFHVPFISWGWQKTIKYRNQSLPVYCVNNKNLHRPNTKPPPEAVCFVYTQAHQPYCFVYLFKMTEKNEIHWGFTVNHGQLLFHWKSR